VRWWHSLLGLALLAAALLCVSLPQGLASGSTTLIQQGAKLVGGEEEVGEGRFGRTVALSADGDTALIGSPRNEKETGAAWVFTRSGSTWTPQAKLTAAEEVGEGRFGRSVALSADGDTAIVGASSNNGGAGAAWIYTRSGSAWTQQAELTGAGEIGNGLFGWSVALSADGSTALVGGMADHGDAGAAWVFTRSGETWTQRGSKLTGGEESGEGTFGESVALSADGETALVGGRHDNSDAGAAWVFTRSGETWTQQGSKLTGGQESGSGWFGDAVALSSEGDTALIGGLKDDGGIGAAWVFTRSGETWTQQGSKLTGGQESGSGQFGDAVALSSEGDTALIGGLQDDGGVGAAWLFAPSGSTWSQEGSKLTGGEEVGKGQFGWSVALSAQAGTALIGGIGDSDHAGAAWVFTVPPAPEPPPGPTQPSGSSTSTSTQSTQTPSTTSARQGVLAFGPTRSVSCKVALRSTKITVRNGGWAMLKLASKGTGACRGRLKLITKVHAGAAEKGMRERGRPSTRTIATAAFSILAGKTSIVRVQLNAAGRSLLIAHHGRLTVNLTILQSSPGPSHISTHRIRLARQGFTGAAGA
jgi:hypothetical protein